LSSRIDKVGAPRREAGAPLFFIAILCLAHTRVSFPEAVKQRGDRGMAKFQLKKAANGEFHFTLTGSDDQALLQSEMYKQKASAESGIESVRKNAGDDGRYERKTSSNGKDYFVLKAGNGQVIGQSRMFDNAGAMESAIGAVKSGAAGAALDDQAG
jgi:uncharacterized protein